MEINYYTRLPKDLSIAISEILTKADNEFVPPLSARSTTTQKNLKSRTINADGISSYLKGIEEQSVIIVTIDEKVVGFMSFKSNYSCEHINDCSFPNIYITTIIVHQEMRGRQIAQKIYDKLLDTAKDMKVKNIFTRTWSTNDKHISVLKSKEFDLYKTIENDRGPGIDTVYYHKSI